MTAAQAANLFFIPPLKEVGFQTSTATVRKGKIPVEFHRQLIDAQAQRTRADYDPQPDLSQIDAEVLVNQAQALVKAATHNLTST